MESLSIDEIIKYTNGVVVNSNDKKNVVYISTDSRDISDETLYIPIIGERLDGHSFLEDAYQNGCRMFLIDENHTFFKDDAFIIKVFDTTLALGDIAGCYRMRYNVPIVGVTGSVGKTTTKDMLASVLSRKYETLTTEGNFNNEIGLPKMVFKLNDNYGAAVLEMGMGCSGDIKHLAAIARPLIGVISNIGMCHIENFINGQDGIFDAKMEITSFFDESNTLVVNGDDTYLKTLKGKKVPYKIYTYGFDKDNDIYCIDYKIKDEKITFTYKYKDICDSVTLPNPAKHNIYNAMAAIVVGDLMGVSMDDIKEGLTNFSLTKNRLDIKSTKKYKIINDTYNANYDSIVSALDVLSRYKRRRVAVLGDVLELGEYSKKIHEKIGEHIKGNTDVLVTIGSDAKYIKDKALELGFDSKDAYYFKSNEEFLNARSSILKDNDVILFKASHAMDFALLVDVMLNEN